MFGEPGERRGLIPRAMEQLFAQADRSPARRRVSFVVTFLEIYCDHIRDLGRAYLEAKVQRAGAPSKARSTSEWLLEPGSRGHFAFGSSGPGPGEVYGAPVEPRAAVPGASEYAHESLTIHEDAEGGVFVKDACVIPVTSVDEVMTIVQLGFRLRATFETRLNAVSSRSHTVFTVNVAQEGASLPLYPTAQSPSLCHPRPLPQTPARGTSSAARSTWWTWPAASASPRATPAGSACARHSPSTAPSPH